MRTHALRPTLSILKATLLGLSLTSLALLAPTATHAKPVKFKIATVAPDGTREPAVLGDLLPRGPHKG